jgi:hypothetical protein
MNSAQRRAVASVFLSIAEAGKLRSAVLSRSRAINRRLPLPVLGEDGEWAWYDAAPGGQPGAIEARRVTPSDFLLVQWLNTEVGVTGVTSARVLFQMLRTCPCVVAIVKSDDVDNPNRTLTVVSVTSKGGPVLLVERLAAHGFHQ